MYMKVFPHGKGGGVGPVNYLVRMDYPGRDEQPPQVLRGDPAMTRELIDAQDRVWKFTAGVLSWAPGEDVTPEQEKALMNDFEAVAFAGLEPDQYDVLWVRHVHAAHHELHFVVPRVELRSGKALNPCPPGWQKDFDVLRDLHNWREGWARPDDPERARAYKPAHTDLARARDIRWSKASPDEFKEDPRKLVHEYIAQRIAAGIVTNRAELVLSLHEVGLETPRLGKDYLTVMDPESRTRIRMKGGVYCEHWRLEKQTPSQNQRGSRDTGADRVRRIRELTAQLERVIEKRAGYNRDRYRSSDCGHERNGFESARAPGGTDKETAMGVSFELAEVGGVGHMPDGRLDVGRVGSERGDEQLHSAPAEPDCCAATPKRGPARDDGPAEPKDLGRAAGRDGAGEIHRAAKEIESQDWLDPRRPRRHQIGAIENEHDRIGAPPFGRVGEDEARIFQATNRAGRGFTENHGDSSRTPESDRTPRQLLQKFGAAVNALERYFGERDAEREIARVFLKRGKDRGGLEK